MSSEILEDIKRATELAHAAGYYEGIHDMAKELGHYMVPVFRKKLVEALIERYEAAHPEIKDETK